VNNLDSGLPFYYMYAIAHTQTQNKSSYIRLKATNKHHMFQYISSEQKLCFIYLFPVPTRFQTIHNPDDVNKYLFVQSGQGYKRKETNMED
jgi:hypothetical protein